MSEFIFALITVILVIVIIYLVNKTLAKRVRERTVFKQEKFSEELNNFDNIINTITKVKVEGEDDKKTEEKTEDDEHKEDELAHTEEHKDEPKEKHETTKRLKHKSSDTRKVIKQKDLKRAVISKEILDKKKRLK